MTISTAYAGYIERTSKEASITYISLTNSMMITKDVARALLAYMREKKTDFCFTPKGIMITAYDCDVALADEGNDKPTETMRECLGMNE